MPPRTHRIVTGHNDKGRSVILYDDEGTNVVDVNSWPGGLRIAELWVTDESPASVDVRGDRSLRPLAHDPRNGGTIFRRLEFPPESSGEIDASAIFDELGSASPPTARMGETHFSMHRTDSIDYLVVISGEMWMMMDEGKVLLSAGDCIVQQGTSHAWINDGTEPCVLAAVLVAARPPAGNQWD